nr:hypothetical protein HmN_000962200 [Hymenolepis microstoma]
MDVYVREVSPGTVPSFPFLRRRILTEPSSMIRRLPVVQKTSTRVTSQSNLTATTTSTESTTPSAYSVDATSWISPILL